MGKTSYTNSEELKKAYEITKEKSFEGTKASEQPTAVYLAGQPGSGKSRMVELSKDNLDNKTAVVIDTDIFRQSHPEYKKIAKESPETMYKVFDAYALDVAGKIVDEAIKSKRNIVFDGTFGGNFDFIKTSMQKMKDTGYNVEINALATNSTVSKMGIAARYEEQLAKIGYGRTVEVSYHDEVYKNIPKNIEKAIETGLVSKYRLYTRDLVSKETSLQKEFTVSENKLSDKHFLNQYQVERNKPLSQEASNKLYEWYNKVKSKIEKRGGDIEGFEKNINIKSIFIEQNEDKSSVKTT
jgi:predicted ABC-type ATPase